MTIRKLSAIVLVMTIAQAACVLAGEARLTVQDPAGVARRPAVVTCGVPFAAGAMKDAARLSVQSSGKAMPAQFAAISRWPDGSVRWALMDCQVDVDANGKAELVVGDGAANPAPLTPVKVQDAADDVTVSTGPLSFVISKKEFNLFRSLKVAGQEILAPTGRGLVLCTAEGKLVTAGKPAEVRVESSGPMRAVVCIKGVFADVHAGQLSYTVRCTAYAGQKMVKVRIWLENNGAHGYKANQEWFFFKSFALELGLDGAQTAEISCDSAKAVGRMRVSQGCPGDKLDRYACKYQNLAFRITSGDKELAKGAKTDGVLAIATPKGKLTAAVRDFWQNYDQALEVDSGTMRFWLWPADGQWPRPNVEMDNVWAWTRKDGLTALPGGVHKEHELVLDFSGRPAAEAAAELSCPLAAANPEYFASTEAANILFAPFGAKTGDDEFDFKLKFRDNMANNLVDGNSKTSLTYARTTPGQWFGWMDFGDVCSPSGGYYAGWTMCRNLHYDWTWSVLLHYMRQGNPNLLRLGGEMARYLENIGQNWSDRDAAPYRALFRADNTAVNLHSLWSNDYPTSLPRPCGNWLSGVVLYYMLTGDPKAMECIERNYKGMQESRIAFIKTAKPGGWNEHVDNRPLGATFWTISNLQSLYALTGDSKYLDDIKVLVNGHLLPAAKAMGPHMFDAAMENAGQGYNMLGEQLCYGLAGLCEYCYRTKDEQVDKLLKDIADKGAPSTFYEAPLYFADLYGFLGQGSKDKALMEKGMRSFADGFPESRIPAVYSEGRADWSVRPPELLRAGSMLHFFCWKQEKSK